MRPFLIPRRKNHEGNSVQIVGETRPACCPNEGKPTEGGVDDLMRHILRLRSWIKPEIRDGLDGLGVVFAITLFFCLIQSAHDGIVNRNHDFDSQRWWYPIYLIVHPAN
jgi:hypothetical protein